LLKHNLNIYRIAIVLVIFLTSCGGNGPVPSERSPEITSTVIPYGQVVTIEKPEGSHHLYIPTTPAISPDIVVLVHGTPGKDETALEVARYYLGNWIEVAEEKGIILIAPAFDQLNFSSKDGEQALGGYRGLFGRQIGADEFVLQLVDTYQTQFGATDPRFYLYGHSAGGQYTARFVVTHPHRIKGAVITAPATYPQPNPDIAWPYGLDELHTRLQWHSPDAKTPVDVVPDLDNWLTATTLPVTVIVGMNDLEWQPDRTGQKGNSRVSIARNWVKDMNNFAAEHNVDGNIKLSLIPNLGHSSIGLLPHSEAALLP